MPRVARWVGAAGVAVIALAALSVVVLRGSARPAAKPPIPPPPTPVTATAVTPTPAGQAPTATGAPSSGGPLFSAVLLVTPRTARPGARLSAHVAVSGCSATARTVDLAARYTGVDGDPATVHGTGTLSGTSLTLERFRVPSDAARGSLADQKLTFTATVSCVGSPLANTTATDRITVADLPPPAIELSTRSIRPGGLVRYTLTGCAGGPAFVDLYDGDDHDTELSLDHVRVSSNGRTIHGSFVVPAKAAPGLAALSVDCAQAAYEEVALRILGSGRPAGSGTPSPGLTARSVPRWDAAAAVRPHGDFVGP